MRNKILLLLFSLVQGNLVEVAKPRTCIDEDIGQQCEGQCEIGYVDCTVSCSNTNCLTECARIFTECVNDCPCNTNCPHGCAGCRHPICDESPICGGNDTAQNKDNLELCKNEKSIDLGQCIIDCRNNQVCESSCVELFKTEYRKCPCQTDCPFGCPCDAFDCIGLSVLVLNTFSSSQVPVLIKYDGDINQNLNFNMGPDTSVHHACSAKLNGEMFIFGGNANDDKNHLRQISKIQDCGLVRIGDLPNDMERMACGTFEFLAKEERVMLCFGYSDTKKCISYNGKEYADHPDSVDGHYSTSIANMNNDLIAVGGWAGKGTGSNELEIFDTSTNTWTTKTPFPFCSMRIHSYGIVNRESSVFIFGGECDRDVSSRIAKYTLDKWEHVGNLQKERWVHRAISNGNRIFVVGGRDSQSTEIWSLDDNGNVNREIAAPQLNNYEYYPELFLVPSDYCSKN